MKKFLKVCATVLAASVLLVGCKGDSKTVDNDKNVTLKWMIMTQGKQQDQELVWEKFSEKLGEYLPNTAVEFVGVPISEFSQKWSLAASAQEKIDLAWTGWVLSYPEEVRKGSYMELDGLLDSYGSDLKASLDDWVWDLMKINGKTYAVPNYQMMGGGRYGMRTHKELADKYLDAAKLQETFYAQPTFNEACWDAIEEYLQTLKDNGELRKGISAYIPEVEFKGYDAVGENFCVKQGDDSYQPEYKFILPEAELKYKKMSEFFKKGFIREDILSMQNVRVDEGKQDGYTVWFNQYYKGQAQTDSAQCGFDVEVIPMSDYYYLPANTGSATSTAIPFTAENPERAMQLMNILYTKKGKDLYNMLVYGLEGQHYEKIDENTIRPFDYGSTPKADSKYGLNKWVCGNTFNAYALESDAIGWNDFIQNEVNDGGKKSPLLGFRVNTDPIKVELAQIKTVTGEFSKPLSSGTVADVEGLYNEYREKLKIAGLDKVKAEFQRQIDEFLKTKGKN